MKVPVLDGTLEEYRLLLEVLESESQPAPEEEAVS
jgi:hypothetical protein